MKERNDPSLSSALLLGLLTALFGVFLGMAYMVTFPLQAFSNEAEYNAALDKKKTPFFGPADRYYFEGTPTPTRAWESKRRQLLGEAEGPITLTAGELNAWLSRHFTPVASPGSAREESSGIEVRPETPNLAIVDDGAMYVNLPTEVRGFGGEGELVISAIGGFSESSPPAFRIRELKLNAAELPLPSILGQRVLDTLIDAFRQSEEYKLIAEAWQSVEAVTLVDGGMHIELR